MQREVYFKRKVVPDRDLGYHYTGKAKAVKDCFFVDQTMIPMMHLLFEVGLI